MVNRAKWMEMQIELWCAFLIDFEKIPFPSQCENITHARHLTLRHSSVSYIKLPWVGEDSSTGCITSHIFIWLLFPVMFPGLALFPWIFWAVNVTKKTVSMLQSVGPGPFLGLSWWPRTVGISQAPWNWSEGKASACTQTSSYHMERSDTVQAVNWSIWQLCP